MEKRDEITNTSLDTRGMRTILMDRGGIAAQEKNGQRELCASEQLPRDGLLGEDRARWESLGVEILDEEPGGHPLFCRVRLPPGWTRRPTDHAMYVDLVDDLGRRRGQIFYKAAFYDQKATLSLLRRFDIRRNFAREDFRATIQYQATSAGSILFQSAALPAYDRGAFGPRAHALNGVLESALILQCQNWLSARGVSDLGDPMAHWDAEVPAGVAGEASPPIAAPAGRLSGGPAIARAQALGIPVLVGTISPEPQEVSVSDARQLVEDGVLPEGIFWLDEPAPGLAAGE